MKVLSPELKVGLFAILVILILSFMTLQVGGLKFTEQEGYLLYANFDSIVGVERDTRIKVAGVNAGLVEEVRLLDGRARVTLRIDPEIIVHEDAVVSVQSIGLLGDKYVALYTGTEPTPVLKEGDTITRTVQPTNYDALVSNLSSMASRFADIAEAVGRVLGDEETTNAIAQSAKNIRIITDRLDDAIAVNDEKLRQLLDNLLEVTGSVQTLIDQEGPAVSETLSGLGELTTFLNREAPTALQQITAAAGDLRVLISEMRQPAIEGAKSLEKLSEQASEAMASLNRVADREEKGEGTLGKLVVDDRLYESVSNAAEGIGAELDRLKKFRTFVEFQGESLTRIGENKGYLNIRFQPAPDRYYLLGVVSDPLGYTREKETVTIVDGASTTTLERTTRRNLEFTALLSRSYHDLEFRAGLMENTFGFGTAYHLQDDRLALFADIWDFRNNEPGAEHPHLKLGAHYVLWNHLVLAAGWDNVLNEELGGLFLGGGIRFEDEDLKYILGTFSGFSGR